MVLHNITRLHGKYTQFAMASYILQVGLELYLLIPTRKYIIGLVFLSRKYDCIMQFINRDNNVGWECRPRFGLWQIKKQRILIQLVLQIRK